jgi:hypothetical protein
MTQDEIKVLELEALIEDLRLNHEYCPKEVILQAADELERLSQRTFVGLTNEELTDLFYNTNLGQQSAVSQAVALLKERNS